MQIVKFPLCCCNEAALSHSPRIGSRYTEERRATLFSDLIGLGSIWSSSVDSNSMWIWIGPSDWWIGVDLVDLTPGAPDLYPIRIAAEESMHNVKPISNSLDSTTDSLSSK